MNTDAPIQIAVLDKGFIYIGRVHVDGDWLIIADALNVRRWGTTRGLGELVHGPTHSTRLNVVGTVRAPLRAVIHLIDVEVAAWAKHMRS